MFLSAVLLFCLAVDFTIARIRRRFARLIASIVVTARSAHGRRREALWYNRVLPQRVHRPLIDTLSGPVAQLAEQQTLNLRVVGSIPTRLTKLSSAL